MTAQPGDTPVKPRPLPVKIGRYDVTGRLGVGAMGVVYSARDSVIDRDVAIKVMNAEVEGSADVRARFIREARIGGLLLHRNITTVLDMGEERGRPFIVMELLHGRPLTAFHRDGTVPLEAKLDLMIQLCEGLSAAHAHDVLHRDIKPSNLYIQDDGTLKILDFGVSRLMGATVTSAGFLVGTPEFMAPEQATGQGLDPRADLFSSSAVFYYLLSGRKPFAGADLAEVLRRVQREPAPPLSDAEAPARLAQIVLRGLAKNPDERPASMADVQAELTAFRRHWQAETRREAARAQHAFESLSSAMAETVAIEQVLGLPGAREGVAGLEALKDRYPLVADLGSEAFVRIPFRRDQVNEILDNLAGLEAGVRTRLALLREHRRRVDATSHRQDAAAGQAVNGSEAADVSSSEATVDVAPLSADTLAQAEERRRQADERAAAERAAAERAAAERAAAERAAAERAAAERAAAERAAAERAAAERAAAERAAAERAAAERAAAEEVARAARRRQAGEHLAAALEASQAASWDTACLEAERALDADPESVDALECLARAKHAHVCEAAAVAVQARYARLLGEARQMAAGGRYAAAARAAERAAALRPDVDDARDAAVDALKAQSAARMAAERERVAGERRRIVARYRGAARRALARGDRAAARQAVDVVIVESPEHEESLALLRETLTPASNPDTVLERVSGWRGLLTSRADAARLVIGRWSDAVWRVWQRWLIRANTS